MKNEIYTSQRQTGGQSPKGRLVSRKPFLKCGTLLVAFALLGSVAFAQAPTAASDVATTSKNMPVTIKVLDNDANYVATKTSIATNPSHGTVQINSATGIVDYWPAADYTGSDQFTYTIKNDRNQEATGQVSITIDDDGCSIPINGNDFSWKYADGSGESEITEQMTQPPTSYGFVFDIYKLDNSFNMIINGTALCSREIQFQSASDDGVNVRFQDGEEYETDGRFIYEIAGGSIHPSVRLQILPDGSIKLFAAKASGGDLYPLELTGGAQFNSIAWNQAADNAITVTQKVDGPTLMEGRGYGLNAVENPVISLNTDDGVAIEAPSTCGGNGIIHLNITGVDDGSYDLAYQGGNFKDVQITSGKANISAPAGVYNNITIGSGNCQSVDGIDAEIYVFPCTADDDVSVEKGTVTGNVLSNDGTNGNTAGFIVTEITIGGQSYTIDPTNGSDIEVTGKGILHVNPDGSFSFEPDASFSGALDEVTYTVDNGHGTKNTGKLQVSINSTLPVSGIQGFNVIRKGHTAILSWSTATELQNKGFRAERSTDGKSWEAIGFKNSLVSDGNSTRQLNYTMVDANPLQQTAYYRLVQVDLNGREHFLSVIKSLNGIVNRLSIYPNPAGDHIIITNATSTIYIYDVSGRNVLTQGLQPGVKNVNLNVQGLSQGIYFVKSGNQRIKLIKK